MVETVMCWNEPHIKSHWAFEIEPGCDFFAEMVKRVGVAALVLDDYAEFCARMVRRYAPPGFAKSSGAAALADDGVLLR